MEPDNFVLWRSNAHLPEKDVDQVLQQVISANMHGCNVGEGNVFTTFFMNDIHSRPEIIFLDFYKEILGQVYSDLCFPGGNFSFDYWCQVYDGEHSVHEHHAPNIYLSFVHFVRPLGEYFYFCRPDGKKAYPKQDEGDIIVFPSWATHGIDASYGSNRVTIAGNIIVQSVANYNTTKVRNDLYITEKYGKD